jgi:hypothetical protein
MTMYLKLCFNKINPIFYYAKVFYIVFLYRFFVEL